MNKNEDALSYYLKCIAIYDVQKEKDSAIQGTLKEKVAEIYFLTGKLNDSQRCANQALKIFF